MMILVDEGCGMIWVEDEDSRQGRRSKKCDGFGCCYEIGPGLRFGRIERTQRS